MPGLRPPNLQPDVNGDEYDEVYIVHKGDSLGSIAAAQGVGLSELLAHNPAITDPNLISIGQLLAVPHAMKSNLGTVTRVVAPRQTAILSGWLSPRRSWSRTSRRCEELDTTQRSWSITQ